MARYLLRVLPLLALELLVGRRGRTMPAAVLAGLGAYVGASGASLVVVALVR